MLDRFLEVKTSLFPSLPPQNAGGGGGGGGVGGVPRQHFRGGPGDPHRVNSWTIGCFAQGIGAFFGKNPFSPPSLCSTNCPIWVLVLPPTPPTFHRGASVSQLFGILPSRLRCSSNHAMRKASFEPTSGFRPFNYALAGSAA